MFRYWRPLNRLVTLLLLVVSVCLLFYFTSIDFLSFDRLTSELVETKSDSGLVDFASFQSALVRIRSRKSDGKLSIVLSVDSADIEELIQEHTSDAITANPYPLDPDLVLSNPALCKDSPDLNWIVYVHTSCKNFERRDLLRKTWANPLLFKDLTFKVVFMMGRASEDVQQDVKKEFDKYGDIVQGDFVDDYKNLTLKAIMSLKWVSTYCPHVPYVMKTDDDSFLNIFEIVKLVRDNRHKSSVIMCPLWQNNTMPILRDRKTCMKWCVKRNELPGMSFFPQYCAGIAYVISRQLVKQLYEASRSTPFFWIDDVYVTGLLTKKVPDRIDYVDLNKRMTLREDMALESYKNQTQPIAYDIVHVHDRLNFIALWNALLDRLTDSQKISLRQDVASYRML